MNQFTASRRMFMQGAAATGLAAGFVASMNSMADAAQTTADYKAIVCIYLRGGNDAFNTLLATDSDSWGRYWTSRWQGSDPIALMPPGTPVVPLGQKSALTGRTVTGKAMPEAWGGVIPITPTTPNSIPAGTATPASGKRSFALHPLLKNTASLFSSGRLAAVANVGTLVAPTTKAQVVGQTGPVPFNLYSHSDQTSTWLTGKIETADSPGYGGSLVDAFSSYNGAGVGFSSVSATTERSFNNGAVVRTYRELVSGGHAGALSVDLMNGAAPGWKYSPAFIQALTTVIKTPIAGNDLAADYSDAVSRALNSSSVFSAAVAPSAKVVPAPPTFYDPISGTATGNGLADQLRAIAETIAANSSLRVKRQVFYAELDGFDTHVSQNARHSVLMAQLDHALGYFDTALQAVGLANNVTAFTASDFGRTLTSNGSGTDHAWGGHHFILGGAVKGGDIYGQYPTVGIDNGTTFNNPNMAGNALIPTTSVEQYLGTIGAWFGVSSSNLGIIFPTLAKFTKTNIGFMSA